MTHRPALDRPEPTSRAAGLLAHLDGSLDAPMLEAFRQVWSTLEHAAPDGVAHGRAVRARMFWNGVEPRSA